MGEADIGLIGLAVMGRNLALNMNDHGYRVAVFNRTISKVDRFCENEAKDTNIIATHDLEEFVRALKKPAKIMLMVKSGKPVDAFIDALLPHLSKGDIIIDGGNSEYTDTTQRCRKLKEKGILFIGTGISGGEEGARHGPSIMPGGNPDAWPHVKEILQSISAKVDSGEPCCDWVGEEGAGHFVKMVHNGIEYGDIQLICEAYDLMKRGLSLKNEQLHQIFGKWNKEELDSYLIEITSEIFTVKDDDGDFVVDKILDTAGQKGTGRWTAKSSLLLGTPLTLISEAVFARSLSAMKEERVQASKILNSKIKPFSGDRNSFIKQIKYALYASKIISYAQGFMLMEQAAKEYKWNLNYGGIALMWRGGCIIRSSFLEDIKNAFEKNPKLSNLLLDDFFFKEIDRCENSWREVAAKAISLGIPIPCMSSALAFFDGYRTERLPANLLQAQRDYFGAHTYERIDKSRGEFFHTNWTGKGGLVSSSSYNA